MNKLTREKQILIVKCLTEGMSMRSTARVADVSRNTVSKLILDLGDACAQYHFDHVRNLKTERVEVDEIWSFVYAKDKNVPKELQGVDGIGSVWTWTAIDANSKLIISYLVGGRDATYAKFFMEDVADRLSNRVQLTSDGHESYLDAVRGAFGGAVDYAQLIKMYGKGPGESSPERKYSPGEVNGIKKKKISGKPVKSLVSTSYVERQNLSMRMGIRRFTRLTNAFSKSHEFHAASVAIYMMHYNFVRIHQTIRCTPAMEAGVTKHLWEIGDMVDLMEQGRFEQALRKENP